MAKRKYSICAALCLGLALALPGQEIFVAARGGDLAKVKELVARDPALVKAKDEAGNTPLHHAVLGGALPLVELLLEKGADVNAENARKHTPLHEAIRRGQAEVARFLIGKGADGNKPDVNLQTPLHWAALANQKDIAAWLLAKGANIDSRDIYQRTPFLQLVRQWDNVEFGRMLADRGADIHVKDRDNLTALNLAAWKGFNGFIDFLLDRGVGYDSSRGQDRTMLLSAAGCGSLRLFRAILEKEKSVLSDAAFGRSIMRAAVTGGNTDIVNLLLARTVPLEDRPDRYGWTLMHLAAANGREAMIRFLAARGFDINRRTLSGKSACNIAEERKQAGVLRALKEMKADAGPKAFPRLTGEWLGQAPPDAGPKLFAPDIVSQVDGDDNHGSFAVAPGGGEIYWNQGRKIWMTRLRDGVWTEPEKVSFSSADSFMDDNPFLTSDGRKLFFTSGRPGSVSEGKENIWFSERTASGWSEPKPVGAEVNAMQLHWGISVSDAGTIYFGGVGQDTHGGVDIYCSKPVNGTYAKPVNLGPAINGRQTDHCPYIAPDESYLIFSRFGGEESGFYISYRDKSGQWLPPVKLPDDWEGVCPLVSPDGKYFFFNSDGIYWMPAGFIQQLRLKSGAGAQIPLR